MKTVAQSSFTENVLRKESPNKKYFFNLRGWVTMVRSNMVGLRRAVGPHARALHQSCWLVTKGSKRKQEEARGNGTLDCRLYFLNQQRSAKSWASH